MARQKSATKPPSKRRMAEKAADGDYEVIDPLDFFILEDLPLEGTIELGLYPHGLTVREITQKLEQRASGAKIRGSMVSGRMRLLHSQKLVASVRTFGTHAESRNSGNLAIGGAWQITKDGQKLLNQWKANQNGN